MVATGLRAQRSRAAAAAPTTPATPMLARVEPAALEVLAAAAEEELGEPPDELEEALEVAGAVAGAVAEGDEADGVVGVVAPPEEGPAGAELLPEALDPEAEELEPLPTQLVEDPPLIVKAADWAVAPVLSRRVNPMEVPEAISDDHVNEVPVC